MGYLHLKTAGTKSASFRTYAEIQGLISCFISVPWDNVSGHQACDFPRTSLVAAFGRGTDWSTLSRVIHWDHGVLERDQIYQPFLCGKQASVFLKKNNTLPKEHWLIKYWLLSGLLQYWLWFLQIQTYSLWACFVTGFFLLKSVKSVAVYLLFCQSQCPGF